MNIRRVIPVLLILAAPAAMLYPLWSNPVSAGEDDVVFYYPLRKMLGAAIAQGQWPLTNPLEATGGPLIADPQAAAMHPATWLFAIMAPKQAYTLSIFLAFIAAGGGMYLYLRRLGLIRTASTFGAMVFMFCGFMVGHRVHLSVIHAAAMLPWILWCIELLRKRAPASATSDGAAGPGDASRPAQAFVVLTAALFLAVAAGHWPTLIHMAIICLPYALLRARPLGKALAVCVGAAALASVMAGPQILATANLLAGTTRQKVGFGTAGENSFFPLSAILALYPMLMGTRTPNLYSQTWWGPWHLCESLGYVGLVTLALAGATAWKFYRKKPKPSRGASVAANAAATAPVTSRDAQASGAVAVDLRDPSHVGLVRAWTWISVGAFIWMLGYYLPTYKLIHMMPILGMVRCPARMLLAIDVALAAMSALAIHYAVGHPFARTIGRTIRRMTLLVLPATMLAALGGWAIVAYWPHSAVEWGYFFTGTQSDAQAAFTPRNMAIWVPLAMTAAAMLSVPIWLRQPGKRAVLPVALVLLDLFFITRFVDVPAANVRPQDPDTSPAAAWLKANAPPAGSYRIFTVGDGYHERASELLRPKTCQSMGFASIGSYGPFQSPAHAQLLGLSITGYCRDWPELLRENYLLSLYNVRYVITADPAVRELLDGVSITDRPPPDGPNLLIGSLSLGEAWEHKHQTKSGSVSTYLFVTPVMWRPSEAVHTVEMSPDTVYRISLDARGPEGGAANHLRAEVADVFSENLHWDRTGLSIRPEEIGTDWRHFEWTFKTPSYCSGPKYFWIHTLSERPIEVRNVSLRPSHFEVPVDPRGVLPGGAKVYKFRAELPPLNDGDAPVAIYENLLSAGDVQFRARDKSTPEYIEWLKWEYPQGDLAAPHDPPDVSLGASAQFSRHIKMMTVPAAAIFLVTGVVLLRPSRRRSTP